LIEKIVAGCEVDAKFVGTLLGHTLKHIEGKFPLMPDFSYNKIYGLLKFLTDKKIQIEIAGEMIPVLYQHSILTTIGYQSNSIKQLLDDVPILQDKFKQINSSKNPDACLRWIMGSMRNKALGNIPLSELKQKAERAVSDD